MTEWVWLNGQTLPLSEARIGIEDRGFQFADGVYEVIRLYGGRPFTLTEHLQRLTRSAEGISLSMPLSIAELARQIETFIPKSGVGDGMIYLQLTRGVSPRNHIFSAQTPPTLLFYARPLPSCPAAGEGDGVKLLAVPDERWKRCWIKSIALLPNVLAKNAAVAAGADEAVMIDNGIVTECAASNIYAIIAGKLVTHPIGPKVLPGITRLVLIDCAALIGLPVQERAATEEEFVRADEVFITSTTREISWVSQWNGRTLWNECGPLTRRLHIALKERISREVRPASAA